MVGRKTDYTPGGLAQRRLCARVGIGILDHAVGLPEPSHPHSPTDLSRMLEAVLLMDIVLQYITIHARYMGIMTCSSLSLAP